MAQLINGDESQAFFPDPYYPPAAYRNDEVFTKQESLSFRAPDNHFIVMVPSRKEAVERAKSPSGLVLTLPKYRDSLDELNHAVRNGLEFNMENEEDTPHPLAGPAVVLAVPERLTADMTICAGPFTRTVPKMERADNGRGPFVESALYTRDIAVPRTAADIMQVVDVGDTLYCADLVFSDETELPGYPGIYRVPVSEVVAKLNDFPNIGVREWEPYGSYVLLRPIYPAGSFQEHIDGRLEWCVKQGELTVVAGPLEGEGEVAYVGLPLYATGVGPLIADADRLAPGMRVVFPAGHGSTYTIEGERLIAVRQDYIQAIREDV